MHEFKLKTAVYFEQQAIDYLKQLEGKRAFIVSDEMMLKLGFIDKVTNVLTESGFQMEIFTDVFPDPDIKMVTKGLEKMMEQLPDVIIALGGGSVIDTAKGILYTYEKMQAGNSIEVKIPKLVAIPSTSGTGSEVTSFSVIKVNDEKLCLVDDVMMPDAAILDSQFVKSVPASVTADTGLDALSHAIEAYVSTKATDFTDALAEKVVKMVFDNLLPVYRDGNNMTAREKMHNASCMAGVAFTNASLGITHSIAHAVGGLFHLPHGRTIGILMPHVIAYNADLKNGGNTLAAQKYAYLAELIGLPSNSAKEGCEKLILAIQVLLQELGIASSFQEYKVDNEEYNRQLDTMGHLAMNDNCTPTNPRVPTIEDIKHIALRAY